ncbi:MAG: MFS transporter [bacterium]|nr:MFS transporter [bacterium]
MIVWGVGSFFGPILASMLMNTTGPEALLWTMGSVRLAVAAYAIYRIVARDGVTISAQERYLHVPARLWRPVDLGRKPR